MTRIFISYRRADSQTISGRIYDRLRADFRRNSLFKDVYDIPPGADFRTIVRDTVLSCNVVLAVIGSQWLTVTGKNGERRLDDPDDFVRLEVESALKAGIRVIPVLVHGAKIPDADDLPPGLRDLTFRNAVQVREDPDFERDMDYLVGYLRREIRDRPRWIYGVVAALAFALVAVAGLAAIFGTSIFSLNRTTDTPAETPTELVGAAAPTTENPPTDAPTDVAEATPTDDVESAPTNALVSTVPDGVASNAEWTPMFDFFDGVEMVQVPPGCFEMGEDGRRGNICFEEPFWIDRYEVTNAQYKACVDDGGCTEPDRSAGYVYDAPENLDLPVVYASWFQARDYARWRGGSLPTEAQWEYAARGPDSLLYPWGDDEPTCDLLNFADCERGFTPGGTFEHDVSWVGAFDLMGNVREWTNTLYPEGLFEFPYNANDGRESEDDEENSRTSRGASFQIPIYDVSIITGWPDTPIYSNVDIGFRTVRPN